MACQTCGLSHHSGIFVSRGAVISNHAAFQLHADMPDGEETRRFAILLNDWYVIVSLAESQSGGLRYVAWGRLKARLQWRIPE